MTETMWQAHIDWVTFTLVGGWHPNINTLDNIEEAQGIVIAALDIFGVRNYDALVWVRPSYGYRYGVVHTETGLRLDLAQNLAKQGLMIVASGQTLRNLGDGHAFYRRGLETGFHVTRLDIAFDLFNSGLSIPKLAVDLNNPEAPGARYKRTFIQSHSGATLSLGGRSSDRYLRIYDKGAEQGNPGDWKRVEIELKGKYLAENADHYAADLLAAAYDVDAMVGGLSPTIDNVMIEAQGKEMPNRVSGELEPSSNKLLWLEKTVMPTLVRMYYENPSDFAKFETTLNERIGTYGQFGNPE